MLVLNVKIDYKSLVMQICDSQSLVWYYTILLSFVFWIRAYKVVSKIASLVKLTDVSLLNL